MGASNKNTRIAAGLTGLSFVFVIIAFASPYWLVSDGKLPNSKFLNLGLWEVCLNKFTDIHRFYDTVWTGCMWVFEEEYYIIHDYLLPGFYIATQFFFTLTFVLSLVSVFLTLIFLRCSRDDDRYVFLLLTTGAVQLFGAFFGLIAVITFGAKGDGRVWMPHWQNNDMGWAYAFAVLGTVFHIPAGCLFMVQARRERYKRLNEIANREISEYASEDYNAHSSKRTREGFQTDI